jgi:histidine ammonia-lyase
MAQKSAQAAPVVLNGADLTVAQVEAVARHGAAVQLAPEAAERVRAARAVVESLEEEAKSQKGWAVYGHVRRQFVDRQMFSLLFLHLIPDFPSRSLIANDCWRTRRRAD